MNRSSFFFSLIKPSQPLVLDFDGVFLDSVNIKANTFASLFSNSSKSQIERIRSHHIKNPSMTRFEKIKIYYEWINKRKLEEIDFNLLVKKFGEISLKLMLKENPSIFIINLLKYRGENTLNYILTKSVENEVAIYTKKYKLDSYIKQIYDFKFDKSSTLVEIASINNVLIEDVVFVGDSFKDKEASDLSGSKFIFYQVGSFNNERKFK